MVLPEQGITLEVGVLAITKLVRLRRHARLAAVVCEAKDVVRARAARPGVGTPESRKVGARHADGDRRDLHDRLQQPLHGPKVPVRRGLELGQRARKEVCVGVMHEQVLHYVRRPRRSFALEIEAGWNADPFGGGDGLESLGRVMPRAVAPSLAH